MKFSITEIKFSTKSIKSSIMEINFSSGFYNNMSF